MAELLVLGKKVIVRDKFSSRNFYPLHRALRWFADGHYLGETEFEAEIQPYLGTVVKWEFPGDPDKLDAWAELDSLTELPALIGAINGHIAEKIEAALATTKNLIAPPTSP